MIRTDENLKLESNIKKYYSFSFLNYFYLHLPFIIYYFQTLGLSLTQIMLAQSAYNLVLFFFEIPSGYITDKIGRKKSVIIGIFLKIISLIILFSSKTFYPIILSQIIYGLSLSIISGADKALIYDTLINLGKEKRFKKIEGIAHLINEIGVVIFGIAGSILVIFGVQILILLTIIFQIILFFICFGFVEPEIKKKEFKPKLIDELKEIKKTLIISFHNKKLFGLIIYSFIVMGFSNSLFILYQPFFVHSGIDVRFFGLIFAFLSLPTAIASLYAEKIENVLGVKRTLLLMPFLVALSFILSSVFPFVLGFIFFIFREFTRGLVFPVIGDYANKLISSDIRATLLSVHSMFSRLGFVVISLIISGLSEKIGLLGAFKYSGITLLIIVFFFAILFRNSK